MGPCFRRDDNEYRQRRARRANHQNLSSLSRKNISLRLSGKSSLQARPVPRRLKRRFAIVTNVARDAVDAAALLTNSANADGEVVWS
jgi:hypothetical protein